MVRGKSKTERMMEKLKLARLDSGLFPMGDFERSLIMEAGDFQIIEIAGYDPDEIAAADPDFIAVVSGYIQEDTISRLKRCRAVIRYGIGYEKIDVDAAARRGIIVCNTTGYCNYEVAEHAMALLLGCARRVPQLQRSMREGSWPQVLPTLTFRRIYGKQLGLIGLGAIGQKIAERAAGFGLELSAFDDYAPDEAYSRLKVRRSSLEELLRTSDFICMACPLNSSTRGMIGREQLALMKKTAVLINTARGGLIDEKALAQALERGQIDYAGIDVYDHFNVFADPPDPPEGYYHGIDRVLLTPHAAYISEEAMQDMYVTAVGQLARIVSGVWPHLCVNPEARLHTDRTYRDV
jgi:D-3-phosphoglycerate dehydrogenase / 2-oxoglutarate reductase